MNSTISPYSTLPALSQPAKVWHFVLALIFVTISFCCFGLTLDRYPQFFGDEPFYNLAAANYAQGKAFAYRIHPDQPYGDSIWTIHGPFYSRLQAITFSVFGLRQSNCRLPQHIAAHLGLLALCCYLLMNGYMKTGLVLPLIWIGDRSSQETLFGRMEGLAFLFLVAGFICYVDYFRRQKLWLISGYGFLLSIATGFHPVSVYFIFVSLLGVLAIFTHHSRWSIAGAFSAGVLPSVLLWMYCWLPDLSKSTEQFVWYLDWAKSTYRDHNPLDIIITLRWSKYWAIGLVLSAILFLIPWTMSLLYRLRKFGKRSLSADESLPAAAGIFCCGFFFFVLWHNFIWPYYLVYFTIWPVLGIVTALDRHPFLGRWAKLWLVCFVTLTALWLPSLAWNGMRFRELVLNYHALDHQPFAARIRSLIPPETPVSGSAEMFLVAKTAGLNFTPLDCGPDQQPPSNAWLFLKGSDQSNLQCPAHHLESRPMILDGIAFPNVTHPAAHLPFRIYGPLPDTTRRDY